MRVDAHHHLWRYSADEYGWIDERMQALRRDFMVEELEREMRLAGVRASVAVQARQTLEETHWLLDVAGTSEVVQGVVGWAPIAGDGFAATLEQLCQNHWLKGLRHVVQAERDGFLGGAEFNRGIARMRGSGLVYDVLIFARQLDEATRFVDRHPEQQFVLDHMGKPDIAGDGLAAWRDGIRELAQRDNVTCKLSGMVTEADWERWTPAMLKPYYETVLEAFGPSRMMVGSDWPVLTVACGYAQWWQTVDGWLAPLSTAEREQIEGGVAAQVYRLADPAGTEDAR